MRNEILEFALLLAEAAEAEIMPVFRKCTATLKTDGSEVTEGDRRAEEAMRKLIAKHMPQHQVLGEEFGGPQQPTKDPVWILDPIDGTASFVLGLPIFGTLIAFVEGGEPQAGVIHHPAMKDTVYAARNYGCWWKLGVSDPQRVHVSKTKDLKDAYVSSYPSGLSSRPRRSRAITDCVQHALVAQGRIDAAIDPLMKPWDIAAIVPCIEEAGGAVTDVNGQRDSIVWRTSLLSSCSASLNQQIVSALGS